MKFLLLGSVNDDTYIGEVHDGIALHEFLEVARVNGQAPAIYSAIPLPIQGTRLFISCATLENGVPGIYKLTVNEFGNGDTVSINSVGDYLNLLGIVRSIAARVNVNIRYVHSLTLY